MTHQNNDNLNVFVVADAYPSSDNAHDAVFVRDQARALSRAVRVGVALRRTYSPRQWWRLGREARQPRVRHDADFDVYQLPRFVPTCRSQWCLRRRSRDSVVAALDQYTRDNGRPDVIHAHCAAFAGEASIDVGAKRRIPVILTEHYSFACDLIARLGRRLLDVYDRADSVLAVSDSLASKLQRAGVARTPGVLGNVVDTESFRYTPLTEPPGPPWRLLSIASDRPVKDVPALVRAMYQVVRTVPAECVIVGDGDFAEARWLIGTLGLRHKVRLRPAASRRELARLIADAHLLVSSSRTETFGLTIAEALCVGRPVVATRSGGPQGIVGDEDGRLVPTGDPEALAEAIVDVLIRYGDYDHRRIAQRGRERFAPDAWLPQMVSVYRSVIANAG